MLSIDYGLIIHVEVAHMQCDGNYTGSVNCVCSRASPYKYSYHAFTYIPFLYTTEKLACDAPRYMFDEWTADSKGNFA